VAPGTAGLAAISAEAGAAASDQCRSFPSAAVNVRSRRKRSVALVEADHRQRTPTSVIKPKRATIAASFAVLRCSPTTLHKQSEDRSAQARDGLGDDADRADLLSQGSEKALQTDLVRLRLGALRRDPLD